MERQTNIPYERVIAWAAGPIAIVAGYLATQLMAHVGLFGSLGLGKNQIAHAIFDVGIFTVGAAVTYAGHHKWLDNLAKWWLVARPESVEPLPVVEQSPMQPTP